MEKFNVWKSKSSASWISIAIFLTGAIILTCALLQSQFALFDYKEWVIPNVDKIEAVNSAWKVRIPSWSRGALAEQYVVFKVNGKPVGTKSQHTSTVADRGNGLYRISGGYLYFSLPLNKDPRAEKARYSLSVPSPVSQRTWMMGFLLFLAGALLMSASPLARKHGDMAIRCMATVPDACLILALFFLGVGMRAWDVAEKPEFSDGWFSVKGVPFSDAEGWDELAINMADGLGFQGGFSAQRPLFPTMLASLYFFMKPSLLALNSLHCFLGGLSVAAVCGIGILSGSRIAGLVGAIGLAINENDSWFQQLFMTEITGTAFTVASILALCIALKKTSWWLVVVSALLLGSANLASGFGMLALPAYGSIVLIAWWCRLGWRRAFSYTTLLVTVITLSWMPWLIRQHQVHGFWNLSASSANLLYATANPAYGRLTPEAASEWERADVPNLEGPRYEFYMKRYREMIAKDPTAYAKKIYGGMKSFFNYWSFEGPDHHGVIMLGLLAAITIHLLRGRAWTVLFSGALVMLCFYELEGGDGFTLWLVGSLLTLLTCKKQHRPAWLLVTGTVLFVALLAGMTGGNLSHRLWTACGWTMPLLIMAGAEGFFLLSAKWLEKVERWFRHQGSAPSVHPTPVVISSTSSAQYASMIILITMLGHAVIASGMATGWYLFKHGKIAVVVTLDADIRAKALEEARKHFDFLSNVTQNDPRLWVSAARVLYSCDIENGEDVGHPAKDFEVRPYSRTVAILKLLDQPNGALLSCQLRISNQEPPKHAALLVIGVHDGETIEGIGIIPIDTKTQPATVLWDRVNWLSATPEAIEILKEKP